MSLVASYSFRVLFVLICCLKHVLGKTEYCLVWQNNVHISIYCTKEINSKEMPNKMTLTKNNLILNWLLFSPIQKKQQSRPWSNLKRYEHQLQCKIELLKSVQMVLRKMFNVKMSTIYAINKTIWTLVSTAIVYKKKTFNTPSKKSDEKLLTNETLSKPNIK